MECDCPECTEYGGPNPTMMSVRFLVLAAQFLVAFVGMIKERSFKALAVMVGALAFFFTVPRYLICCRCEGYGEKCYPLYLGKITSLYLPKVEGKRVTPLAAGLEGITLNTLAITPAVGLRKNLKLEFVYLFLANLTLLLQFRHACRHCARYATDWRKECIGARAARRYFGD